MILSHRLACSHLQATAENSGFNERLLNLIGATNSPGSKVESRERLLALAARLSKGFTGEKFRFPTWANAQDRVRELPKAEPDTSVRPGVAAKPAPKAVEQFPISVNGKHSRPEQVRSGYTVVPTLGKSSKRSSSSRLVENAVSHESNRKGFGALKAVQSASSINSGHRIRASPQRNLFHSATSRSRASPHGEVAYIRSNQVIPISGDFEAPPQPLIIAGDLRRQASRSSSLEALRGLSRQYQSMGLVVDRSARSARPEHRSSRSLKAIGSYGSLDRSVSPRANEKISLSLKESSPFSKSPQLAVFQKTASALPAASQRRHLEHVDTSTNGNPFQIAAAHRRAIPPSSYLHVDRDNNRSSAVSADVSQMSAGQPQNRSQHGARQGSGTPLVVNLVGDVVVDGRQFGRIAASSQAREASLPAHGPSRVNLRAVPLFPGMQIPR